MCEQACFLLCWRRGGNFSVALSCTESLVAGILPFSYSLLISCCCEHNGWEAQKQNGVGGLLYAQVWWLSLPVGTAALPLGSGGALQQQTPACAFWFLLTSSPSYLPIFNLKQGGGLLVSRGLSQGTVGILRLVALPSSSSKQCWYNGQTLARNHLEEHPKLRSLILSALNYHSCLNVACCWISSPS